MVDAKISGMRGRFGEIGDQRLTIMGAITLADVWSEANERAREFEAEIAKLKGHTAAAAHSGPRKLRWLGEAVQRTERVAQKLNESSWEWGHRLASGDCA